MKSDLNVSVARFRYDAFGLSLLSEMEFSGLLPGLDTNEGDTVFIERGVVPRQLRTPFEISGPIQATPDECLLNYPGSCHIHVIGRERLVVETETGADPALLKTHILGAGLSIIGLRRGRLPLHTSAVAFGNQAIAFAGPSGGGKSTLAGYLVESGFELIADDLCLLGFETPDTISIAPGIAELRLRDDAIQALGWIPEARLAYQTNAAKSIFEAQRGKAHWFTLRSIYLLERASPQVPAGIYRLEGIYAIRRLMTNLRVWSLLLGLSNPAKNLERLGRLVRQVPIYVFVRHWSLDHYAEETDRLIEHFQTNVPTPPYPNAFAI
ncbi:conserved hypothetical protein [Gammaproteobacteria bacterium]